MAPFKFLMVTLHDPSYFFTRSDNAQTKSGPIKNPLKGGS